MSNIIQLPEITNPLKYMVQNEITKGPGSDSSDS